MRIWSIYLIKSALKWCIHLGRSLLSHFNYMYLVSVTVWGPRRCSLRSTSVDRSVLRASKFSVFKLTEIVIVWVYYTILFGFSLIWHFLGITFHFLNYFGKGSLIRVHYPKCAYGSILFIKSGLKWCIHLGKSIFSHFNYLVSVTAGGPRSPRGHI